MFLRGLETLHKAIRPSGLGALLVLLANKIFSSWTVAAVEGLIVDLQHRLASQRVEQLFVNAEPTRSQL